MYKRSQAWVPTLSLSPRPRALLHCLLQRWILLLSPNKIRAVTLICLRAMTHGLSKTRGAVMLKALIIVETRTKEHTLA